MKQLRFIVAGIVFGIIMSKSEAFSWYRIQEMFRFQSFHMFGIIGVAVVLGVIGLSLIRKFKLKDFHGNDIILPSKEGGFSRYLFGGIIFGLGWALTGACPGPMFVTLGAGYWTMAIVILSAILGTLAFGLIRRS
jgi:uncharacterized protein